MYLNVIYYTVKENFNNKVKPVLCDFLRARSTALCDKVCQ